MRIALLITFLCLISSCRSAEVDPRTSIIKFIIKESHEQVPKTSKENED